MVRQKLKKPSSFWQIKKLCHQYALKDHDEVEKLIISTVDLDWYHYMVYHQI